MSLLKTFDALSTVIVEKRKRNYFDILQKGSKTNVKKQGKLA